MSWQGIVKAYLGGALVLLVGLVLTLTGNSDIGVPVITLGAGTLIDLSGQSGPVPIVKPEK